MAAEMYQKDLLGLEAAAKARMNFLAVGRYLLAAMLSATEERKQQNLQSFRKCYESSWRLMKRDLNLISAEGQALISEFDRIWPTYKSEATKVEAMFTCRTVTAIQCL